MALDRPAEITVQALARRVCLLIWNGSAPPPARDLRVFIGGQRIRPPFIQTSLALDAGSQRNVLAVGVELPSSPAAIEIKTLNSQTLAYCEGGDRNIRHIREFEAHVLLARLDGGERARLARFLLEVCASLFHLSADAMFIAHARSLLAEIGVGTGMLSARCTLQPGQVFCEGVVPEALGERLSALVLTSDGVHRIVTPPALLPAEQTAAGIERLGIVLPRVAAARGASVIIFGENGLVCRKLGPLSRRLSDVHEWLARNVDRKPHHRRYLFDCLAESLPSDPDSRILLRELQAMCRGSGSGHGPAAAGGRIDQIIGCAEGIFVSGRIADPHSVVEAVLVERRGAVHAVALEALARFPASDGGAGFALFVDAADRGGDSPVRLYLRLHSGARVELGEGPTLLSTEQARAAVLATLAETTTPDGALFACIERTLCALSRETDSVAEPAGVFDCGALLCEPEASVIIPFVEDSELLHSRMSGFAADRSFAGVELLFLVDRPERGAEIDRLLTSLHAVYGIASRLLVFEGSVTPGARLNAAVAQARGPLLAFLGAAAVPEASGWLRTLGRFIYGRPSRGIVGAQALYPDHSLVSAGTGVGLDSRGTWNIRPLLAGFPRDYAPASVPTRVTAVGFDCAVVRRSLLRDVGGFATEYQLDEAMQIDLCLRARANGMEVWRLPEPAAFRLGGTVLAASAANAELDRRMLEHRWRADLENDVIGIRQHPAAQPTMSEEAPTQRAAVHAYTAQLAAIQRAA